MVRLCARSRLTLHALHFSFHDNLSLQAKSAVEFDHVRGPARSAREIIQGAGVQARAVLCLLLPCASPWMTPDRAASSRPQSRCKEDVGRLLSFFRAQRSTR